jgi:hypothetical protein
MAEAGKKSIQRFVAGAHERPGHLMTGSRRGLMKVK